MYNIDIKIKQKRKEMETKLYEFILIPSQNKMEVKEHQVKETAKQFKKLSGCFDYRVLSVFSKESLDVVLSSYGRFNILSRSNDKKKARALFVEALQKEQQSKKEKLEHQKREFEEYNDRTNALIIKLNQESLEE